jgi:hypothetical protein
MTTPWERITDDAYKSWLSERQIIASEYNGTSLVDRSALRGQFEQQQFEQQQQQQQQVSFFIIHLSAFDYLLCVRTCFFVFLYFDCYSESQ